MHGKLTVITGPMFSGKTEKLIHLIRIASDTGKLVVAYKPRIDNRYADDKIVSHSKLSFPAHAIINNHTIQSSLAAPHRPVGLVAIDEVQFFGPWMVEEALSLLQRGIDVMVSGLDLTYQGHPFGIMPELLCLADEIHKLAATCAKCGARATRSYRTAASAAAVLVGGAEAYEPRCLGCFSP